MKIDTGHGTTIPIITLISIYSISALISLPGLAVSPILGDLNKVFPGISDMEIQTLTSLPSLLIIPFILLSGKLTEKINNYLILKIGLYFFALSAVLYLISDKMWQLIAVSALLGIGSGMIVPLSTGLISRYFYGDARTKQYGYTSAITNVTLVLATMVTGFLANINWKLPFVVYLLPVISIFLIGYLKKEISSPVKQESEQESEQEISGKYGIDIRKLIYYMLYYGVATYVVLVITFNIPFLMEKYRFSSDVSGFLISLFFLAIMLPGFFLRPIVSFLGRKVYGLCLIIVAVGLCCIAISHSIILITIGCVLTGLAYGVLQPLVYDKTSAIAVPNKVTMALAIVMSMNYVAILVCPFIIGAAQDIFQIKGETFAFWFNMLVALLVWVIVRIREIKVYRK